MSPAGRKPTAATSQAVRAATRPLHPLRSYTAHDSLRDMVTDAGFHWDAGYNVGELTTAVRAALNTALAPHGLRFSNSDMFFTNAEYDDDSDLVIGRVLLDLDIATLAASHRVPGRV